MDGRKMSSLFTKKLDKIAKELTLSGAAINIISSTLHDTSIANTNINPTFTFNPIEKIVELYERMLQTEKEKNELLQKLLDKK